MILISKKGFLRAKLRNPEYSYHAYQNKISYLNGLISINKINLFNRCIRLTTNLQ